MAEDFTMSYTNSKGDKVTVSEEHLKKALEIKLDLQKNSPSRTCSWPKHKREMQAEGFDDSDSNDSYRHMIKRYQAKLREMGIEPKENEINQTEYIKQIVGDARFERQRNQDVLADIRRHKRELTRTAVIAEMIKDTMKELNWNFPPSIYKPRLASTGTIGELVVSDWHIAAIVKNVLGNNYNVDIARDRVMEMLVPQALDYCTLFNITDLNVTCTGDMTEHAYMRKSQSYEVQFGLAQQIVEASKLLIDMLAELAQHVNVNFSYISGNHDRASGDKDHLLEGDSVMTVIGFTVEQFIKMSQSERMSMGTYDDSYPFSISKEINGSKIKFVHGDFDGISDALKLEKHSSLDSVHYDAIVAGHYHHYRAIERSYGSMEIYAGSLMGRNNYAKKHLKQATDASQLFLVIRPDGDIIPIRIKVQT